MSQNYGINNSINLRNQDQYYKGERLFSIVLVLMLVLGVYLMPGIPSISIGEVVLIVSFIILAIKKRFIRIFNDGLLMLFIIYSVIISFAVALAEHGVLMNTFTRIVRDSFYYIAIYVFAFSFLDYSTFTKWVKKICVFLAIFIIIQEIVFISTGYLIPGLLFSGTVTETRTVTQIYQHMLVSANRNGYLKANGFLTEGAHCAQALAIGTLASYDFTKHDKKDIRLAAFFTIASAMTFSASALFFSGLIWMMIVLSMIKQKRVNHNIGIVLVVFLIVVIGFGFFGGNMGFSSVLNRLLNASSSSTADNSAFFRIYKGFAYWNGLPLTNKIIGIGFGNYESLYTLYQGEITEMLLSEYMNSLSYILVSSGIIGFLIFVSFFIKLFKNSNYKGKMFILLILFMSISSSPYSSTYWIWMMTFTLFNAYSRCDEE